MQRLFVYGSLRSGFNVPAYEYIRRYFVLMGPAKVQGLLYDRGAYPGAVPSNESRYIAGELYEAKSEADFKYAIAQLDDYEGVQEEPPLFRREAVTVFYNNETVTAWIYWFNRDVSGSVLIESGDYARREK